MNPDEPLYRDPNQSVEARVRDLLARMTVDEKLAQLAGVWSTALVEDGRFSETKAAEALRNGAGHLTRVGGSTGLPAAGERRAGERLPALAHREYAPGHTGHRPRGELRRVRRCRRDHLPAGHRPRQHVGAGAHRGGDPRHQDADARRRGTPDAGARPRRRARPALGAHRGDVRRGPLPHLANGRRLRAGRPGRRPAVGDRRHGQALRRLQRIGGRTELGAGAHRQARAARSLRHAVRSRGPRGEASAPS